MKPMQLDKTDNSAESLAEAVYETLMEAIVSGRFAPGTPLSAVKLSQQLDVSRTPVQQALRLLAGDGLVEFATGRRAKVATFNGDDLFHVFEMRRLLEGPAAELAAGRMDRRQLEPLRRAADELASSRDSVGWVQSWTKYDEDFHRTIASCCGNPLLQKDITRYHLLHRGFNLIATDPDSLGLALDQHLEILAALEEHDGARARRAMEDHISHWQMFFVEKLGRRS